MKVSFTTKEYTRLLELAHMGLWVAGARPDDPATMPERYEEIAQKLLELAQPFGCADLVETDVNGELFITEKLTEGPAGDKIEAFIEEAFWGELAMRMAERDLRVEQGEAAVEQRGDLPTEAELTRLEELEDSYWREFEANGVDHMMVLKGGKG